MAKETITAKYAQKIDGEFKLDADGKKIYTEVPAEFDFGETLEDLVKIAKGNKDAIYSNAVANLRVVLQAVIRTKHQAGFTPDQIQKEITDYVPGVAVRKVAADPIAAAKQAFAGMSEDKQKAFIKELMGK